MFFIIFFLFYATTFGLCIMDPNTTIFLLNITHFNARLVDRGLIVRVLENNKLIIIVGRHKYLNYICQENKTQRVLQSATLHYEYADETCIIEVPKVTKEMSTEWNCTMKDNPGKLPLNIIFKVHVIASDVEEYPIISINDKDLNRTITNTTDTKYDVITTYLYQEDKVININCQYRNRDLILRYCNSLGNCTKVNTGYSIVKYSKQMTVDDNGNSIECVMKNSESSKYIYKVNFVLLESKDNFQIIIICSLVALVVVLTPIIITKIVCWRRRNTKTDEISQDDGDYIELAENSDTTKGITPPSNNNNEKYVNLLEPLPVYAVSNMCIEQMYAKPLKKSERLAKKTIDNPDPLYSEPIERRMLY